MAGYNRNSYQYETSPRKIQPEYSPNRTKKQRNTSKKVSDSNKKITKVQEQKKNHPFDDSFFCFLHLN